MRTYKDGSTSLNADDIAAYEAMRSSGNDLGGWDNVKDRISGNVKRRRTRTQRRNDAKRAIREAAEMAEAKREARNAASRVRYAIKKAEAADAAA